MNSTLAKLSSQQIAAFPKVRVLMIAGKQSSYTLDSAQCARANFDLADIWDVDDLCKRSMELPIDVLQSVYNYVRAELARVKIELEIPDAEGNFPTNLKDYIEAIPKPHMSDLTKFNKYLEGEGEGETIEQTRATFEVLSRAHPVYDGSYPHAAMSTAE